MMMREGMDIKNIETRWAVGAAGFFVFIFIQQVVR